jgi:hypothetical protein
MVRGGLATGQAGDYSGSRPGAFARMAWDLGLSLSKIAMAMTTLADRTFQ